MHIVPVKSSNILTLDRNWMCDVLYCIWENIYFLYMLPVLSLLSPCPLLLMLNAHFCSSHCTGRMAKVPFPATTKILRSSQDAIELIIYCHMQISPGVTQPPFQHAPETFIFTVVKQVQ